MGPQEILTDGVIYQIVRDPAPGIQQKTTDPAAPMSLYYPHQDLTRGDYKPCIGEPVYFTGTTYNDPRYGLTYRVQFADGSTRWAKPGNVAPI